MTSRTVYLVSNKLDLATDVEIAIAEQALGARFPTGYQGYVTTLGLGQLNDRIRVLMPSEIVERTREFRENQTYLTTSAEADGFSRWDLFEAGLDLLSPDRVLSSILLVEAGDGEQIIFHPDAPDDLFLLPHEDTWIYRAGSTLEEAITWLLTGEPYGSKWRMLAANGEFEDRLVRYFEPQQGRERLTFDLEEVVTFGEVRAHLLMLARQKPDETLLVSELFPDEDEEGVEHEILHFFAKEYGGAVWCSDVHAQHEGNVVQIAYDQDLHTASLDQLIEFCGFRALRFN